VAAVKLCKKCKRELPATEYAAPFRTCCKACELYDSTLANTKGKGAPLAMDRDDVIAVFGSSDERRCYYCGISEASYVGLGVPTPSGKPGLRLGLDRKDSSAPYRADNVVVCCLVCNRLKSATFNHDEMLALGKQVMLIWQERGLDAELVR
jgi:hypothetical protein